MEMMLKLMEVCAIMGAGLGLVSGYPEYAEPDALNGNASLGTASLVSGYPEYAEPDALNGNASLGTASLGFPCPRGCGAMRPYRYGGGAMRP